MEPGNNNAAPADRQTGAASLTCLALLLCVFLLVCGVAAAAERPGGSGVPTVMLYVGSG